MYRAVTGNDMIGILQMMFVANADLQQMIILMDLEVAQQWRNSDI